MCGHDGHIAVLLCAVDVLCKHRDKIPSNKTVRLLFQPSEEGPDSGALPMVKEGCLNGVDEVYGFHNIPTFTEGDIRVIKGGGPVMAASTMVRITVKGRGGHGSLPHKINDVITAGAAVLQNLHTIKSRCLHNKDNCIFTICNFTSGHTYNVFPDEAFMQGMIRSYDENVRELITEKIHQIATHTAEAHGCIADVNIFKVYPAVVNHAKETDHVIRLAKEWFGPEHFSEEDMPVTCSEDFSYFL